MIKNILAFLTELKSTKAKADELKEKYDGMVAELIEYATGKHERDEKGSIKFTVGQYTVNISHCVRNGIDEKRLKAEKPDIATEYAKVTEYDRTTVK